jgi:hypothetical protein
MHSVDGTRNEPTTLTLEGYVSLMRIANVLDNNQRSIDSVA